MIPLYCFIYYGLVVFYPFCEYIDYQTTVSGLSIPCFLVDPLISKFDLIAHQILPLIIINISTLALFVRYVRQKANLRGTIEWRTQKRLLIQVASRFVTFAGLQFPWTILQLCGLFGFPLDSLGNKKNYMFFFGGSVILLSPFACCGTLPNVSKKLKAFFCCKKQQIRVVQIAIPANNIQKMNH